MKLNVLPDSPWYAEGLAFGCTQCGNCCTGGPGFVWISEEEIQKLAEYLKVPVEEAKEKYCRPLGGRISLKERFNRGSYDCIFLTEIPATNDAGAKQARRVCSVYLARPGQCRTWPFWKENLASESAWADANKRCPGIGMGKHYGLPEIEGICDAEEG